MRDVVLVVLAAGCLLGFAMAVVGLVMACYCGVRLAEWHLIARRHRAGLPLTGRQRRLYDEAAARQERAR